jgi:hypothetical protein
MQMGMKVVSDKVPYLTTQFLEQDAAALLADYSLTTCKSISVPIPIEDIVEKYHKLSIGFYDMHEHFEVPRSGLGHQPDILGAIDFGSSQIMVDESLDPEEFPEKEPRYRFTLAHEIGHFRLHRELFSTTATCDELFAGPIPAVFLSKKFIQTKPRIEWQADYYSSCILMPRHLVIAAWNEIDWCWFPHPPGSVAPSDSFRINVHIESWNFYGHDGVDVVREVSERIIKPLARKFLVSYTAMRIRLEDLHLLCRVVTQIN